MITTKNFFVNTSPDIDVVLIGHEVRRAISEIKESGLATVMAPHSGAAIVVIEQDEKLIEKMKEGLKPFLESGLNHALLSKSLTLPVEKGRLIFEPWQDVYLIDFDTAGKRREFKVQVFSESAEPQRGCPSGGQPLGKI